MEKRIQLIELLTKIGYFILAIILAIAVVFDIISTAPLLTSLKYGTNEVYNILYKTPIGEILSDITVSEYAPFFTIAFAAIGAFFYNLSWVHIVFLVFFIGNLVLLFIHPKWQLYLQYLKGNLILIGLFVAKYLIFVLFYFIFASSDARIGVFIGTIFYFIIDLGISFILFLYMLKFIFNIGEDVKKIVNAY